MFFILLLLLIRQQNYINYNSFTIQLDMFMI